MSKLDKTEVLNAFEAAYEAANGKKPEITTKPGWYSIDGGKNMRLADVAALVKQLSLKQKKHLKHQRKKPKLKPLHRLKQLRKHRSLLLQQTMMVTKLKSFGLLT